MSLAGQSVIVFKKEVGSSCRYSSEGLGWLRGAVFGPGEAGGMIYFNVRVM